MKSACPDRVAASIPKRPLGRTGLEVSSLSLGTAALGLAYGLPGIDCQQPDFDMAVDVVKWAWNAGITFFDTAPAYGVAESVIGAALSDAPGAVIASKFLFANDLINASSTDIFSAMRISVESSLKSLRRDKLDVLQLHSVTAEQLKDERLLRALASLRAEGFLTATGASVYGEAAALAAIDSGVIDVVQIAFNVLDQRPLRYVFSEADRRGVALITRSALLKGALTTRWRTLPPSLLSLKHAVERIVDDLQIDDRSLSETALRFCLGHVPPISSVIIGASSTAEVDQAISAINKGELEDELRSRCANLAICDDFVLDPWRWPAA